MSRRFVIPHVSLRRSESISLQRAATPLKTAALQTVLALLPCSVLAAQDVWFERNPLVAPPARLASPLAFDEVRQVFVMFGGFNGATHLDDTWEYDGASWIQRTPSVRPSPRHAHCLAWDPVSQKVLLFGGTGSVLYNDTWTWDGSLWTQYNPLAASPGPRSSPCFGSTPSVPGVLLLGGQGIPSSTFFGDFWHWNGSAWSLLAGATPVGTRAQGKMAYDPSVGLILVGGHNTVPAGVFYNDTWRLNGGVWSQLSVGTYGSPRAGLGAAFVPDRGRIAVFGGYNYSGFYNDAWELSPSGWQQLLAPQPPSPRGCAFAASPTTGSLLLFGGLAPSGAALSDTWVFGESTPPTVSPFGTGCSWGSGTPALAAPHLPWNGDAFGLLATALPPSGASLLGVGVQTPVPIDLQPLGAPGCFVLLDLVAGVAVLPGVIAGGASSWTFAIPPGFTGTFATQAFALEATANPLGLVVSNGISAGVP